MTKFNPLTSGAKCIIGQIKGKQTIAFATDARDAVHCLNAAGYIPEMLEVGVDESAITQFRRGYAHGGGWRPFEGFEVSQDEDGMFSLEYPGDPKYAEFVRFVLPPHNDKPLEWVSVFPHSWVMVVSDPFGEATVSIARMD